MSETAFVMPDVHVSDMVLWFDSPSTSPPTPLKQLARPSSKSQASPYVSPSLSTCNGFESCGQLSHSSPTPSSSVSAWEVLDGVEPEVAEVVARGVTAHATAVGELDWLAAAGLDVGLHVGFHRAVAQERGDLGVAVGRKRVDRAERV